MWNIGPSLGSCVPPAGEHSPTYRPYTDESTGALPFPQGTWYIRVDSMFDNPPSTDGMAGLVDTHQRHSPEVGVT